MEVCPIESAEQMAKRMTDIVLPDYPFAAGDEVAVLVSGLGATPVMELYVLYNEVEKILSAKGIKVHRSYVGNYFTSLDMMGRNTDGNETGRGAQDLVRRPCLDRWPAAEVTGGRNGSI